MSKVKLPRAVREQERAADEAWAREQEAQNATPDDEQETTTEQASDAAAKDGDNPPPQADEPARNPDIEKLEHRLNVLLGKYNSEVPRLSQELKEEKQKREAAESELKALKEAQSAPTEPEFDSNRLTQLQDDFGPEMVELARLTAQELMAKERERIRKEIQNEMHAKYQGEVSDLKEYVAQDRKQSFQDVLRDRVPNWESINAEPGWLEWLGEADPLTGRTRQELLDEAANSLDAKRVAAFFLEYQRLAKANDPREQLQRQVAPGKSKGTVEPRERRKFSETDYERLMTEVRQGKWRGREKELEAREREIWADIA